MRLLWILFRYIVSLKTQQDRIWSSCLSTGLNTALKWDVFYFYTCKIIWITLLTMNLTLHTCTSGPHPPSFHLLNLKCIYTHIVVSCHIGYLLDLFRRALAFIITYIHITKNERQLMKEWWYHLVQQACWATSDIPSSDHTKIPQFKYLHCIVFQLWNAIMKIRIGP